MRKERTGEGRRDSHHPLLYGALSLFPHRDNLLSRSIGSIGISKYHKSELFFSLLRKFVKYLQDSSGLVLKRTISTIVEK